MTYVLNPNQQTIVSGEEGGGTLSITNNNEDQDGQYTIAVNDGGAVQHGIDAGTSDNYEVGDGERVKIVNTGQAALEIDFA